MEECTGGKYVLGIVLVLVQVLEYGDLHCAFVGSFSGSFGYFIEDADAPYCLFCG